MENLFIMGSKRSKAGSALLIVLGMFSFMLVSAVAFSIYMRASRAPSSYLRRNAATRQLVRAALARAIDEIDTAIGNDPFPGVGYNHDYGNNANINHNSVKNDNWRGRVFVPSNEVAYAETVSTMTLEGLGYVPSAIANEARYWSRHTRTAKWHPFNFGMGRYAFTAINVSDFFDLNAYADSAGGARRQYLNRSSAPHGRVSPAYLFRGGDTADMDSGGSAAAAFLNVLSSGAGIGGGDSPSLSDVPFVSMMDVNLAIVAAGNLGGLASPYANLIRHNNSSTYYSGAEASAKRSVFMAGGWNSDSNLTYAAYSGTYPNGVNLRYEEYQPFDGYGWFPSATTLSHCYNDVAVSHPFWKPYNNNFPIVATALLCDYLDFDSVPLSLCIPSVEAVPMICGIELNDNSVKYGVNVMPDEVIAEANAEQGTKKKIKRTYAFTVEVSGLEATLTAAFPFYNGQQGNQSTYAAEAFARVFFKEEIDHPGLDDTGTRTPLGDLGAMDVNQWKTSAENIAAYVQAAGGEAKVNAEMISGVGNEAQENAVQPDILISLNAPKKSVALADLVYEVDEDGKETLVPAECVNHNNIAFYNNAWEAVNFLEELVNDRNPEVRFRPNVAVWARIRDGGNNTVDLVPAVPANDILNNRPENENLNGFKAAGGGLAGVPLMRFFPKTDDKATGIVLTKEYFAANNNSMRDAQWKQKAYIANDPRMNWAPEQWWATDQTQNPKRLWLDAVRAFQGANQFRDQDISMSASNQGYLQSMWEWMMIPQVRELHVTGNAEWGAFENGVGYNGQVRTSANDVLHNGVMWRTYRSYAFNKDLGKDGDWGELDDLEFHEADNGIRVNPYTDMMPVMLGAFANMPWDWWSAGTNTLAAGKNYMSPGTSQFMKDYLFDWSCVYKDVNRMAYYWMAAFGRTELAAEPRGESLYMPDAWKDVFDDGAVNWRTGQLLRTYPDPASDSETLDKNAIAGFNDTVQTILRDNMSVADRKFLYGYLRGCFANTHQLFLVFVRAEASSGGAAGSGGKAVALVWRDPKAPTNQSGQFVKADGGGEDPQYGKDNGSKYMKRNGNEPEFSWRLENREYPPHRTRVLFYRPLD